MTVAYGEGARQRVCRGDGSDAVRMRGKKGCVVKERGERGSWRWLEGREREMLQGGGG